MGEAPDQRAPTKQGLKPTKVPNSHVLAKTVFSLLKHRDEFKSSQDQMCAEVVSWLSSRHYMISNRVPIGHTVREARAARQLQPGCLPSNFRLMKISSKIVFLYFYLFIFENSHDGRGTWSKGPDESPKFSCFGENCVSTIRTQGWV